MTTLADKYGDERRTSIEAVSGEVDIEDLIPEETCVFTLTHEGYIKRTTLDTYQAQNRGGRGVQGMTQKDDDFTEELFVGSTHDYMLFMTDQGRVYRLKGYQVPEGSRTAKGTHIVNLLQLQEGEKVTLMLQQAADVDEDNTYATMVTKMGLIKRTPLSQFRNIRKAGLIAIALNEGDSLVCSHLTKGDDEIIVATHDGAAIHFTESGARAMGRTGHGVRVIKLREGDYVIGAGVCRPGASVLTITEEESQNSDMPRVEPAERAQRANDAGAVLLFSIHGNSDPSGTASGFECYAIPPGQQYHDESVALARLTAQKITQTGQPLRGQDGVRYIYFDTYDNRMVYESSDETPHNEPTFRLLADADCPAVLVEQCFLTNPQDAARLATPSGAKQAAKAYYEAICEWMEGR